MICSPPTRFIKNSNNNRQELAYYGPVGRVNKFFLDHSGAATEGSPLRISLEPISAGFLEFLQQILLAMAFGLAKR